MLTLETISSAPSTTASRSFRQARSCCCPSIPVYSSLQGSRQAVTPLARASSGKTSEQIAPSIGSILFSLTLYIGDFHYIGHELLDNRRNSAPGDERNGFIWQIFRDVDAEKLRINEAKPTDRHCHAQRQPKLAKPGAAVTSTNIIPREHQPNSPTVQTLTNIGEPFPPTANINESPRRAWFRRPWAFDQVSHGGGPAPNNSVQ